MLHPNLTCNFFSRHHLHRQASIFVFITTAIFIPNTPSIPRYPFLHLAPHTLHRHLSHVFTGPT
ncbi:hypothetical protein HanIR_Chr06g0268861 [Helianthus annuus]|nr:hypothetical protein HanIR_Chr06g0268861 [Helianthus annuus]